MLYIDFAINKDDILSNKEKKLPRIIRKCLCFIKNIEGQVLKYKLENNGTVIVLPKITKKTLKKLDKLLKIDVTKNVCICDELLNKEQFMTYINEKELNIIDGRWLFKYMMVDVVKYICLELNVLSEKQEISILTNENDKNVFESIIKLSENVKNINIITRDPKKFKKLEEKVYKENGLILNITNNYKKALLKSTIILNLNFVQEDINKILFPRNSVIVNFENELKVNQKGFLGVNCSFYNISLPIKYFKLYKSLPHFNSVNLYESFIYKKTMIQNIWKELKEDNIKILCLEGKNGIIKFENKLKEVKIS
mgnify:CR=1 FL=1